MKRTSKTLKKGDKVTWNTSQGTTEGVVEKKVTSAAKVKGYTAKPTKKNPEYQVRSSKTGKKAIHKPKQLSKKKK